MEATPKKLKNPNGNFILPVTHSDFVHVDGNGTSLTSKISSLENSIGNGGTPPNLPEGVIDPRNIQHVEVLREATGNLFDLRTVEVDGYYDQPSGLWRWDVGNYSSSTLIKVSPSTQYTSKNSAITTYWNSNKEYINFTRSKTFTTPSNAAYVRIALLNTNVASEMFVKGSSVPTSYVSYGEYPTYSLPPSIFVAEPQIKGVDIKHLSDATKEYVKKEINEHERLERTRGKVNLFIETSYEGYNQPIHPKVLYFPNGWNGYKYWMATTPYPYAIDSTENPHIHVSNDMLNWVAPPGLINPIDDLTDNFVAYWSDTHLVYRSDTNTLECWYRGRINTNDTVNVVRRTTTNGITWTAREVLYNTSGGGFLSHSVIWENNKYKAWVCGSGGGVYDITADGKTWTKIGNMSYSINGVTFPMWHIDVEKTDLGYEMVVQPTTNNCLTIDHYTSVDGIVWSNKKSLMQKSAIGIDAGGFYRACLLKINGMYYVFSSTISSTGERGITLSYATKENDIFSLKGIDVEHLPFMHAPTRKPRGGYDGQVVFDQTLNKAIICTKGGRNAVWKDFNGTTV